MGFRLGSDIQSSIYMYLDLDLLSKNGKLDLDLDNHNPLSISLCAL